MVWEAMEFGQQPKKNMTMPQLSLLLQREIPFMIPGVMMKIIGSIDGTISGTSQTTGFTTSTIMSAKQIETGIRVLIRKEASRNMKSG